jgi:beta-lactamase regulating signal transducer with metallopeptidase domain
MILPYLVRLAILSLACFLLVHVALAIGLNLLVPWIMAMAKRSKPSSAAGLLLAARLFPSAAALLVVAGICVPSYLWLEPEATVEQVGLGCLAAALLSVVSCGISARRGLRAIALSTLYERYCRQLGQEQELAPENTHVCVIEDAAGLFALAGILHPRLVISREVLQNLSAVELEVALRHERAHSISRDNLKRLLLLLAPDILPFSMWGRLASLERGWAQFTEWAADDKAVDGDSRRAVSLAGALVRVARMGAPAEASPLMTSLVADGQDLEARVNRLLGVAPASEKPSHGRSMALTAMILVAACFVAALSAPATLQTAHQLLEHLIR